MNHEMDINSIRGVEEDGSTLVLPVIMKLSAFDEINIQDTTTE